MIGVHLAEAITACLPGILCKFIAPAAVASTLETCSKQLQFTTQGVKVTLSSTNIIWYGKLYEMVNYLWWSFLCQIRSFRQRDEEDSQEW